METYCCPCHAALMLTVVHLCQHHIAHIIHILYCNIPWHAMSHAMHASWQVICLHAHIDCYCVVTTCLHSRLVGVWLRQIVNFSIGGEEQQHLATAFKVLPLTCGQPCLVTVLAVCWCSVGSCRVTTQPSTTAISTRQACTVGGQELVGGAGANSAWCTSHARASAVRHTQPEGSKDTGQS